MQLCDKRTVRLMKEALVYKRHSSVKGHWLFTESLFWELGNQKGFVVLGAGKQKHLYIIIVCFVVSIYGPYKAWQGSWSDP